MVSGAEKAALSNAGDKIDINLLQIAIIRHFVAKKS